ncbi:MAG: hypothetical protein HC914_15725 [Chloroflexaceae bacterium]|nr:hypothetical protein [Chloroflexaceae bacterium]
MTMSLGTLPAAMLDATSATLAEMPGVRAVALDAAWAEHIGQMRDQVATIRSYAWEAPPLAWFRVALLGVGSRTSVLSLLAFPQLAYNLPLLGAEIVCINESVTMAIIDWVPMSPAAPGSAEVARIRQQFAHLPNSAELPDWAAGSFSPHLFYVRPQTSLSAAALLAVFHAYVQATCRCVPRLRPPATRPRPLQHKSASASPNWPALLAAQC